MKIRRITEGAALGGILGGAVGTILTGTMLVLPGGREIMIVKAVADIAIAAAAASTATTVSASAVGTLIGAATGAVTKEKK